MKFSAIAHLSPLFYLSFDTKEKSGKDGGVKEQAKNIAFITVHSMVSAIFSALDENGFF
ncbi:MAG TPA: hypothetical protein IAD47_04785 [Candidatus Limihabitans stercoravium]|nr:hypothetical protein [Candidatus Limihabitans stercoravium]